MVFRRMDATAMGHAHHDGQRDATACAVAHARHVITDLVECRVDKTHELNFGYGLETLGRHAHSHARDDAFGQHGVLYAQCAKTLL